VKIFEHLQFDEICRIQRSSKVLRKLLQCLTADVHYVRLCAKSGFRDGVKGRVRGQCWRRISGAETIKKRLAANSKTNLYQKLLEREASEQENVLKDACRTLVHYEAFDDEKTADRTLANLLLAYSVHDNEVGYCQGMNFVAGFILTKLEEEEAYWLFYHLMTSPKFCLRSFFLPDLSGMIMCKFQFTHLFEWFLPDLYAHFAKREMHSDLLTEWFMTLFTFAGFPRETACRIWDLFLVDGLQVIHKVALAILARAESDLMQLDFEQIIGYLKRAEKDLVLLNADAVMKTADSFNVSSEMLQRLERQYLRLKSDSEAINNLI
jgi:hypothetical protein